MSEDRKNLVEAVAGNLHGGQPMDGARLIAEFSDIPRSAVTSQEVAIELCSSLFYWCLNNDHYEWAASMIWSERLFTYKPRCTRMVWEEIRRSNALMLMGAASMSKSYGAGAWLLLDWVRDPEYTSVNLVGPSEDHLKDNLFTHLVDMHKSSTLPLPGYVSELFIGLDSHSRKGAIRGVVIPVGKRPSGRLQGRKRVPRKIPHPVLGPLSRIRFFLDEVEKIPVGVFKDIDNVFSNLDKDVDGFKILCSFNPEDPAGQVAARCEPEKGWVEFDLENDEKWKSKRGWNVLRLDAAKCENVIESRVIYPGLQTREGFEAIIKNAGGRDTPGYWTMARACFPRAGAIYSVISDLLISRCTRTFLFAEDPVNLCGGDLALEGKDAAKLCFGRFGKAVGYRCEPSLDYPKGRTVMFKDRLGKPLFRWGLQVDKFVDLPNGDTVKMATAIRNECILNKILPSGLMLDRTGNGAGVHDLLKSLWSEQVMGVNYTEAATERKILEEDSKTAKDEYDRVVTELWFALKKWMEFLFLAYGPLAMSEELKKQLTGRRYNASKQNRVETKEEYKSRGNSSPNDADALTLLLHAARIAFSVVPSALDHVTPETVVGFGPTERGDMPILVDSTNRTSSLEDESDENRDWMT